MGDLSPNQVKALDLLLNKGYSVVGTARALGLTEDAVDRWKNGPNHVEFKAEYRRRLGLARETGQRELLALVVGSVEKVREVTFDEFDRSMVGVMSVKLKGAGDILDRAGLPRILRNELGGKDGEAIRTQNENSEKVNLAGRPPHLVERYLNALDELLAAPEVGGDGVEG